MKARLLLILISSIILTSCQSFNKNSSEFDEDEFSDETDLDLEESEEESFEVIEEEEQIEELNEKILEEDETVEVPDKIYFDFNSRSLSENAKKSAQLQYLWLENNPDIQITIEGHCDDRGTKEYNISLGAKRANSLKQYFINRGINPSRIKTISYGEEKPYLIGTGDEIWKKNRRAVITER